MGAIVVPEKAFPNGLEDISKHFGLNQALARIKGPLSLRSALELSQPRLARLLGFYLGHAYSRATIATWERVERGVRLPARYAMTDKVRAAYGQLLADVVELAGQGQLRVCMRLGPRRWRFHLERDCANCGRAFVPRRSNQVHCQRCIGRNRR